jgi:hypothetical protein
VILNIDNDGNVISLFNIGEMQRTVRRCRVHCIELRRDRDLSHGAEHVDEAFSFEVFINLDDRRYVIPPYDNVPDNVDKFLAPCASRLPRHMGIFGTWKPAKKLIVRLK